MLPTEAFAEAIAFLRLFDLNALAVTNALCSSLAVKASTTIRWEQFPGLRFCVASRLIQVCRARHMEHVASLHFATETAVAEFVAAAFSNCMIDDMYISNKRLLNAVGRVAESVVVTRTLRLGSMDPDDLGLVRKFRTVKALQLPRSHGSEEEIKQIASFFSGSGIRELLYNPSKLLFNSKPKKFALF